MAASRPTSSLRPWACFGAFAGFVLALQRPPACTALEILDSVVDRDGDVLIVEDILEGFGRVPVSVDFSAVSDHMFIAFKAGAVRVYPDGGETEMAAVFDTCVDMEEDVRELLAARVFLALFAHEMSQAINEYLKVLTHISVCGSNTFFYTEFSVVYISPLMSVISSMLL